MGISQTKDDANLSNLASSLQGLGRSTLPGLFTVAVLLTLGLLVNGIAVGAAVDASMLAFGNGLLVISAVGAICVWDLWSTVSLILSILELIGMQEEELLKSLREYFQSVQSAHGNGEAHLTLIGTAYIQLADMFYRKCQAILLWCPLLAAIVVLGCLVVGSASDAPTGLIILYGIVFAVASIFAIIGVTVLRYCIRPALGCKTKQLIDPYLEMMLRNLENDTVVAGSTADKDSQLERGASTGSAACDGTPNSTVIVSTSGEHQGSAAGGGTPKGGNEYTSYIYMQGAA